MTSDPNPSQSESASQSSDTQRLQRVADDAARKVASPPRSTAEIIAATAIDVLAMGAAVVLAIVFQDTVFRYAALTLVGVLAGVRVNDLWGGNKGGPPSVGGMGAIIVTALAAVAHSKGGVS